MGREVSRKYYDSEEGQVKVARMNLNSTTFDRKKHKRDICVIVGLVLVVFLLSANRAWVHHRVKNGEYWVLNYPPNIPFMWQYDTDANMQLSSTALFPYYYKLQPMFTDRPGMQVSAYLIGQVVGAVSRPLYQSEYAQAILDYGAKLIQVSDIPKLLAVEKISYDVAAQLIIKYFNAAAGIILFKLLSYCVALVLMCRLVGRYLGQEYGLYAACFFLLSGNLLNAIGIYHTYEFQVLTPIYIIFLYSSLCDNYTIRRNIAYSILVGCLMLIKPNYASYIAVLVFSMLLLRVEARVLLSGILISIVAHSAPWVVWHWFLESNGMGILGILGSQNLVGEAPPLHPYTIIINEFLMTDSARLTSKLDSGLPGGGGPTVLQSEFLSHRDFGVVGMFQLVLNNIELSLRVFAFPLGILAVVGAYVAWINREMRPIVIMAILMLGTSWLQGFVAFPFDFHSRTMRDPSFLIFGLGVFGLFKVTNVLGSKRQKQLVIVLLVITLTISVLNHVQLPWVHPMDQHGLYTKENTSG